MIPEGIAPPGWRGNVLVDGFLAAAWKLAAGKGPVDLTIEPLRRLTKREYAEMDDESDRLLAWLRGSQPGRG